MRHHLIALLSASLVGGLLWAGPAQAIDSTEVKALFTTPPREYTNGPLWVWNDMLTQEQMLNSLRELAGQNVRQAFVHPRPGLMTPYLSRDWFHLWKAAVEEAKRLDMNIWIYDENSYPSGFAGGWVPEMMPEARGRGLVLNEFKAGEALPQDVVGIYRLDGNTIKNLKPSADVEPQAGDLIASVIRAGNNPWHGNRCYVDLMYPGVTEKFLDITLNAYKQNLGDEFGKHIPGVFTDEPNLSPAGGLPWTPDLPEVFQKRWGYSLIENLPCLYREVGDWKRVRHNYYAVCNQLFIERWAKPYHDYCEANNLQFTGHYWDHEWPNCTAVPDNMAMYAWHQRPAIDCLMNQYNEGVHGQFGNARMVRELASVANQLGRPRTLCEAYGAGGWDLRFEDMKRIGDWLEVLGVNTLDEHLSYITIRGARKHDHPQSFSYHEPWWQDYHVMATYFARLSAVMSQGEQINKILLIEPTTTAWMYNGSQERKALDTLGDTFQKLLMDFEAAQVEYDIGDEDIIARHGSVDGSNFKVGKRSYNAVVIPPLTENLDGKTMDLLEAYVKGGGVIMGLGQPPTLVNGQLSDRCGKLAQAQTWISADVRQGALSSLRPPYPPDDNFAVFPETPNQAMLFHHRRQLADGQILLLTNTSIEKDVKGRVQATAEGIERWNLETGQVEPYPFKVWTMVGNRDMPAMRGASAEFDLPPCGSLLLFLSKNSLRAGDSPRGNATTIKPSGDVAIKPVEPNVLTLDYLDVTAGGETKANLYFYQACQFAFQKNGLPRNPWDSAVQYKDELINQRFAADSGFEAGYKFTIADAVPKQLFIVIERPDLYVIHCNNQPVVPITGQWWLDRAFGKIDISGVAKVGENVVTLKAAPFTIFHELQSAYVLGEFTLKPAEKGFVITPDQPLKLGKWNEQGAPFYSAGVTYTEKFDVGSPSGQYRVSLDPGGRASRPPSGTATTPPSWYGSVARVKVNGKDCGRIFAAPWECDVTAAIQPGENVVEVTVVGTLKNTLGPHHGKHALGSAWPSMFHEGPADGPPPGEKYSTVGYGLFEPFVMKQVHE